MIKVNLKNTVKKDTEKALHIPTPTKLLKNCYYYSINNKVRYVKISYQKNYLNKKNSVCLRPHGRSENILKKCSYELYIIIN